MTQRGPVPLPVTARYSVPLRLGVRVRGNQWRCGRWPGQAGPLKGPCQWAGPRLPETAAGLGSTGTGRHWQWLQLEVASATVALGLGARTPGAGLLLVGPPGCLRFGTAGPRCLS